MSQRDEYTPGAPCWVDTLQPDVGAARTFYEGLFDWEFTGPGATPGDPPGEYFVSRVNGRDVAGVGSATGSVAPAWTTYVSVASAEEAARKATAAGGNVVVPPLDAPPAGRLAVIADASGGVIGVWEPHARKGAQLVNEPGAWAMSGLRTGDPEAAAAFYRRLFGWETESFMDGIWVFRLPGYVGGEPSQPVPRDVVAALVANSDAGPSQWGVDFWVGDADAAAERAARTGGSVLAPPSDATGLRQVVLADPAGAAFTVTTAPGPR